MEPAQARGDGWTPGPGGRPPSSPGLWCAEPPWGPDVSPRAPGTHCGRPDQRGHGCRDSARVPRPSVCCVCVTAGRGVGVTPALSECVTPPTGQNPKVDVRSPQTMGMARALLKHHTQATPRTTPKGEQRGGARDCGWPLSPASAGRSKPGPQGGRGPRSRPARPWPGALCLALLVGVDADCSAAVCRGCPRARKDAGTVGPSSARVEHTRGVPKGWRRGAG